MKLSIFCFILAQISETSNLNFDKINRNFHSIHSTEDAPTTSVRNLATTMKGEMSDEQKLERKVITNQMSQFLSDQKAIYLASLQQIHDSIRTPPLLSFIQDLATNRDFCSAFTCYKQTNFLYEDETLHVTTQKHTVTLQEQVLLTCSLLHENMVSIYHNTQCTTDGLVFQPIDSSIPPLPVSSLDPIEHNIPCRTAPSDLINGNIIVLCLSVV